MEPKYTTPFEKYRNCEAYDPSTNQLLRNEGIIDFSTR